MKKRKIKGRLIAMLLLLAFTTSFAQTEGFRYRRALGPVAAGWRQLTVPDAVFGKASPGLADLRILGVSAGGDTLEAPYVIRATTKVEAVKRVPFKTFNTTHNAQGYYYTFEVPDDETVNEIVLELDNRNFDWRVQLEGSGDQTEWFGILDDYRILDIDNAQTQFRFTNLRFPPVRYRYLRLRIKGSEAPQRLRAGLSKTDTTAGSFRTYQPQNVQHTEDRSAKQTVVTWSLPLPVPVSELHIPVLDSMDYYRPVRIEALTDSFKTPDGWRYQWTPFAAGTLHSLAPGDLSFEERVLQQLRLVIDNGDNRPLSLGPVVASGASYALLARFTEPADYFLLYGRPHAAPPDYDIAHFPQRLPEEAPILPVGEEEAISTQDALSVKPLFQNKLWLWGIIALIAVLLGWATLRMLRKEGGEGS